MIADIIAVIGSIDIVMGNWIGEALPIYGRDANCRLDRGLDSNRQSEIVNRQFK
jgi:hypothetical protein